VDWNVVFGSVPELSFAVDPGSADRIPQASLGSGGS
jgi:hypothetical protein